VTDIGEAVTNFYADAMRTIDPEFVTLKANLSVKQGE